MFLALKLFCYLCTTVFLKYVICTIFSDLTDFRKCSGISTVDFEQVNAAGKEASNILPHHGVPLTIHIIPLLFTGPCFFRFIWTSVATNNRDFDKSKKEKATYKLTSFSLLPLPLKLRTV